MPDEQREQERWTFRRYANGATEWISPGPPYGRNIEVVSAELAFLLAARVEELERELESEKSDKRAVRGDLLYASGRRNEWKARAEAVEQAARELLKRWEDLDSQDHLEDCVQPADGDWCSCGYDKIQAAFVDEARDRLREIVNPIRTLSINPKGALSTESNQSGSEGKRA